MFANPNQLVKPRVLMVVGKLNPKSGIAQHIFTLAKALSQRGYSVAIATRFVESYQNTETDNGQISQAYFAQEHPHLDFFFLPFPNLSFRKSPVKILQDLKLYIQCILRLNTAIQNFQPDVIHCHSLSTLPCLQCANLFNKIPIITTIHSDINARSKKLHSTMLLEFIGRVVINAFNILLKGTLLGHRIIAVSSELKQQIKQELNTNPQIIELIPHGVDERRFRPASQLERVAARQSMNIPEAAQVVCLIGTLRQIKGHDILIKAIHQLRLEGLDMIALFAGEGNEDWKKEIIELAIDCKVIDLISFVGFSDTFTILAASDLLVAPSRQEAFSLVCVEAMHCGVVPIRTCTSGAQDQIEDGQQGFIIPHEDASVLADRIKTLLLNTRLKRRMSILAHRKALSTFTLGAMVDKTIAVYERAIADTQQSRPAKPSTLPAVSEEASSREPLKTP